MGFDATTPPPLPHRNTPNPSPQGTIRASGAEEKVVKYVYLVSSQDIVDMKQAGGIFPSGYAAPQSSPNSMMMEYLSSQELKAYVLTYRDFSDAARAAAADRNAGSNKMRIWKVKTTPNMFPQSSFASIPDGEGERFLALGGVHRGQIMGYYKMGNNPERQRTATIRQGATPKEAGYKYVASRGYKAMTYSKQRHVFASELSDEVRDDIQTLLALPDCRVPGSGRRMRRWTSCVWREGISEAKDLKTGQVSEQAVEEMKVKQALDSSRPAEQRDERIPSQTKDFNLEVEQVSKQGNQNLRAKQPLYASLSSRQGSGKLTSRPNPESNPFNLKDPPLPSENTHISIPSSPEENVEQAVARIDGNELAIMADGIASQLFKDVIRRLRINLPRYFNGAVTTTAALRVELAKVTSIRSWSIGYGSGALLAAVTTSYVWDLVHAWRDEQVSHLDKMAVTMSPFPLAGCSFKAMSDTDAGVLSPAGTSLCFIGDSLLFTPFAPMSVFFRALGSVVDHLEQESVGYIIRRHDAGWKKHYDELQHEIQSEAFRFNVSERYATEQAVIVYGATEQMGMLLAGKRIAHRDEIKKVEAKTLLEIRSILQAMCGRMRYKKLWYRAWLPVTLGHLMRAQAANYTASFLERQTNRTLMELASERDMAVITDFRFPQPASRALEREAAVRDKLKMLTNRLGILKRVDVEKQVESIDMLAEDVLSKIDFSLPDMCNCPVQVDEIELLLSIRNSTTQLEAALLCAASKGYNDVVKHILVKALSTVDINAVDEDGNTALMLAVKGSHASIIDMLLSADADKDAVNKKGETAALISAKADKYHHGPPPRRSRRIDTVMPDNHYTTNQTAFKPKRSRRIDTSMADNAYTLL
ncbi:Bordetella pertussis toxin A [Ophiocordyceps camponoti-floridani]|uniref:Bordetella pertussis toxin A n=1 Tax=Ophiocordyceps camponoti-floridani TaxID=2030778 RepID=A0A8H4QEJ9_9HYPO|nr:Bordetella pertussis toxin A [Ophiocordyceps camponoti-floridani]